MTIDGEDLLQVSHEHVNSYIRSADQKASILLTAQIAFLALSVNTVSGSWPYLSHYVQIFGYLFIFFGLISVFFSGWVIFPRLEKPSSKGAIFWEHIDSFESADEFNKHLSHIEEEAALLEYSTEVYNVSRIAIEKYSWLRRSLITSSIMVFFATAGVLSYILHSFIGGLVASFLIFALIFLPIRCL